MTDNTDITTLVVGATGKTGSRVADRLRAGGNPVRAGSRSSQPPFDWGDRSTWAPALTGVDSVYVSYYPDLAVPGAADAIGELADLAAGLGVRRIVLLSGRGEPEARRAERELAAAGVDWTVVRCSWFAQNFSEGQLLEPVLAGELALPVDGVPEPFVDVEDVADVAVAALRGDGHAGEIYELTGPRLLTFAEAVDEIAAAAGRDVRYVPITQEAYRAELGALGLPDDLVWLLDYLFTEVLDGRNAQTTDGVARALGREPRDFRDFARAAAAAGAWSAR